MCADVLHYPGSATEALAELASCRTTTELLESAHRMWCGPACGRTVACTFLHYPRAAPAPVIRRAGRERYNRDTAGLFQLMGGDGYAEDTPQTHGTNLWPLLLGITARADAGEGERIDYSDWARKGDATAAEVVAYACRDVLQWVASWSGEHFSQDPTYLRYVAASTIVDDLCIPPLDLVGGRFRLYGHGVDDLVAAMDEEGWGHDAVHALLSLVRQWVYQYAEKLDHGQGGLHARLNDSTGIWDACVFRMHSANNYGCGIAVARAGDTGPVSFDWLMGSGMADAISMDLAKSALDVYRLDAHQPTANGEFDAVRQQAYHSVYLDLIDDLVESGAPEELVHYGRAGLQYVQMMERYHERRLGRRLLLRPAVSARLRGLFGAEAVEPWVEGRYRAQRARSAAGPAGWVPGGPTGLGTSGAYVRGW
ncbi:hypothetical protein F4556_006077 [Kitasatospora gansuensis]|uniref:Uncharacterized protein n=2 Tax=Kitasatospora TaxID=2063 RepID=A0A7W7SI68_9ACTN|nr:hypothetical protein [Kitasatospora gansuensis]MBB4950542.1 hypothetical protein [Kitasatospora gansuensis]